MLGDNPSCLHESVLKDSSSLQSLLLHTHSPTNNVEMDIENSMINTVRIWLYT